MAKVHSLKLFEQILHLHCHRYVYWENRRTLILSDLHLGKPGHFRKNGISVPMQVFEDDLHRLGAAIQLHQPEKILVIGDLFHSSHNAEHDMFLQWREQNPTPILLVPGNHDVLTEEWYNRAGISIAAERWKEGPFTFVHDHDEDYSTDQFVFSGHVHPGVTLYGNARQRVHLPCFYFGRTFALLPAFGRFTGSVSVEMEKEASVFAITENEIFAFTKSGKKKVHQLKN